ncbi:MAG: hypothetical protein KAS86_04125, partial [Candidatus Omnitrophica bacterium]|nr:hypothetical protein [Candidatus Omnitrophota bacterium]
QSGAFWYTGWGHHIFYSMAEGISLPLTAAGSAGLLLLFFNKGWRGRIFASFAVMFYLMLVFKSQPFSRYVLPLVPFFAIGAAYLIFGFLSERAKPRGLRNALAVAAVLLLLPTLVKSVKADILFSSRDTRAAAADWIKEGLPPGTKIACDSTTFRPALRQPYSQLEEKKAFLESQPALADLKSRKLVLMMKAAENRDKGYPVFFLFEDPEAQGQFLDTVPALPYDIFALREQGIGYVVINGQITDRAKQRFLAELGAAGEKVRDFSPYADGVFRQSRDRTATTCIPVMSRELFSRKSTGPSLRVYRIK